MSADSSKRSREVAAVYAALYVVLGLASTTLAGLIIYGMLPCGYRDTIELFWEMGYFGAWMVLSSVSSLTLGIGILIMILRRRALSTWILLGGGLLVAFEAPFVWAASLPAIWAVGHSWCLVQLVRLRRAR